MIIITKKKKKANNLNNYTVSSNPMEYESFLNRST